MTPDDIITRLRLDPHPEGGFFRQTWASDVTDADGRPTATCIYYLLRREDANRWHKVDADEIWLHLAGAPLTLRISAVEAGPAQRFLLTPDLAKGEPQLRVPAHHWQSAECLGDWTLVSCVVSPGFRFDGFTLAPAGFDIPD